MTSPYPDHPQLTGNFAPIRMECDIDDVIVRGDLPRDLDVTYYRNGPDPQFPPRADHHWFAGDGMVHMFRIQDGRIRYRNRWVRTGKWSLERGEGRSPFDPFNPLDNDPLTQGVADEGLANTGEMLFFGYMAAGMFSREVSYQTVDAQGRLTRSERFDAPFSSTMHDFMATAEHAVFPVFPVTASMERAMAGGPPLAWDPDMGTHVGVMRRDGSVSEMRWFETEACYVFHPVNAYSENNRIVAHMMQFEEVPLFPRVDGRSTDSAKAQARLCEWTIDLGDNAGGISRRYLDDLSGGFPRLDERFALNGYRHAYCAGNVGQSGRHFNAVVHYDLPSSTREDYVLPEGDTVGEPVFVPRTADAPEGDGYLLCIVHRGGDNRSDLVFLDATDVAAGPVACAELPHRVPYGFHGNSKPNE